MTAFILAGGHSSRMGRDKALLPFQGRLLIEHAVTLLASIGLEPRIAGSRHDLAVFAPIVADLHPGCGPLGGIEAALSCSEQEQTLFMPVDLPLMPPEFLRALLDRAQLTGAAATIPLLGGQPQPLCAVYSRSLLPAVTQAITAGDYKVMRAVSGSGLAPDIFSVESAAAARGNFGVFLPAHRWFANLNSPSDLAGLA